MNSLICGDLRSLISRGIDMNRSEQFYFSDRQQLKLARELARDIFYQYIPDGNLFHIWAHISDNILHLEYAKYKIICNPECPQGITGPQFTYALDLGDPEGIERLRITILDQTEELERDVTTLDQIEEQNIKCNQESKEG